VSITKRASKFIKKQTDKLFNQEEVSDDKLIIGEVDLIEDDSTQNNNKALTSLAKINEINAKDILDKRLKDVKSSKKDKVINGRLDEIERRLYGIENDIEDDEKCIVKNQDSIELISHRTEACETRIRVVEDRLQKLEKDFKVTEEQTTSMDMFLKEESYGFLYLNIKNSLELKLKNRDYSTTRKCVFSLLSFIISLMFIWINTEATLLIGSLMILVPIILGTISLLLNFSKWFSFLKLKMKNTTYDNAILEYLKNDIDLYFSLVDKKKKFDNCNELLDFDEFIKMEKSSIKKNVLNVIVTLIVIGILFVFLNRFLYLNTAYTFFEIIGFPFTIISNFFVI
jgi:hypothetical protein